MVILHHGIAGAMTQICESRRRTTAGGMHQEIGMDSAKSLEADLLSGTFFSTGTGAQEVLY